MPLKPLHLDVPEEDYLLALPEEVLPAEIEPPNWALKALMHNTGRALEPLPDYEPHYVSPSGPMGFSPGPMMPLMNAKQRQEYQEVWNKALSKRERKGSTPSQLRLTPAGNLTENEYRYWKGLGSAVGSGMRECRWCQRTLMNPVQARNHFRNGNQCDKRLLALYKFALHYDKQNKLCFACGKKTIHKHWGVPLCDHVACYSRWKFGERHYLTGMMGYIELALSGQVKDPWLEIGPEVPIGKRKD